MKKTAIIVAGGTGQRMGTTLPKQFLAIEGKSILLHTVGQFVAAFSDIHFVIVLPADYIPVSYTHLTLPTNREV